MGLARKLAIYGLSASLSGILYTKANSKNINNLENIINTNSGASDLILENMLPSAPMGHTYEKVYVPNSRYKYYYIHRFYFVPEEVAEMSKSAYKAQPYANIALERMWDVGGFGETSLKEIKGVFDFIGRTILAFELNYYARHWQGGNYLEIRFRSRADEGGKIGLEIATIAAQMWKKLYGGDFKQE